MYKDVEAKAEAAYEAMYDAPRHDVKDHHDDAQLYFEQAALLAEEQGLVDEADRLRKRALHVHAVFNSQFRWL
jgi:hypothetical protein